MKYKYSRKTIVKKISYYMNVKFPYRLIDDLLATKPSKKPSKEKKLSCGGYSNGKSTFIEIMGKVYGVKISTPTPSTNIEPIEFEEIEPLKGTLSYPDYCESLAIAIKDITERLNDLITNQKKIIDYINTIQK